MEREEDKSPDENCGKDEDIEEGKNPNKNMNTKMNYGTYRDRVGNNGCNTVMD